MILNFNRAIFTLALVLLGWRAVAQQPAPELTLRIESQPIGAALKQLADQAGLQLVYPTDVVNPRLIAPALEGKYTAAAALTQLLEGSGLSYHFINPQTVAIRAKPRHVGSAAPAARGPEPAVRGDVPAALVLARGDTQAASGDGAQSEIDSRLKPAAGVPEILVKGSRVINADIQRSEDDPQPYVVFDREQIQRSMAINLEDFLKTRLPMNTVQQTNSQLVNSTQGTQSAINLRGLGTTQTLVLVDGRRMPNVNTGGGGSLGQPDINGIPLSAIERIEVLPSTASGIYGGGATGGVINIITRQDYTGVDLSLAYGNTFDTDSASRRIDANAGFALEGGRTRLLLTASHTDTNSLLVGDRDFAQRGRALQYANNKAAFFNSSTPPAGYTSNIRSLDGLTLRLDAALGGAVLNSPVTFVPAGYAGPASDRGAALLANAGRYNLDLPEDLNGAGQSLIRNPAVQSASLNLRRAFGRRLEAMVDLSWRDNQSRAWFAGIQSFTTLPADAPNNPFTTGIAISFPVTSLSTPIDSSSELLRATGGLILRLPREWMAAADYVWSRSRATFSLTTPVIGDPDGTGPGISGTTALGNGTLDVMRDLNLYPLDYSPYALPAPNLFFGPGGAILQDATLRLSGPLLRLPAGRLIVSGLMEERDEQIEGSFLQQMNPSAVSSLSFLPPRSQTVRSYYLEIRAPLVAAGRPLLRELELQASTRRDEYETQAPNPSTAAVVSRSGPFPAVTYVHNEVQATRYTFGLRYSPGADLALRASIGTGFLPPSVQQIVRTGPFTTTVALVDRKRGAVSANVGPFPRYQGGNPDLQPEDSESWSAGAVFTPSFLAGLRLSVDYTRIEKVSEIGSLALQQMLDLEDFFPGRVKRAQLEAADAARGYTAGAILEMDISSLNLAEARVQAYDFQADYRWRSDSFGQFQVYAIATRQMDFERRAVPTAPFLDSVGYSFGPLEWRGNAGMNWERGPWMLGWSTQYYDSYLAYSAGSATATINTTRLNQGSVSIPRQIYHDLLARYRFDDFPGGSVLAGAEIMVGIQNLFDDVPPILATTSGIGGYSTYGDPRLRRYSVSFRKSFGLN